MRPNWNPGDRCKIKPIFTLPASVQSHWLMRSPYYYPATVVRLMHTAMKTIVIVQLDDHGALPLAEGDRLQTASLFELHALACRCRGCRKAPSNWRAEGWPTRIKRCIVALLRGSSYALAWCCRQVWAPRPAAESGK
jgi:hypothetical protein